MGKAGAVLVAGWSSSQLRLPGKKATRSPKTVANRLPPWINLGQRKTLLQEQRAQDLFVPYMENFHETLKKRYRVIR